MSASIRIVADGSPTYGYGHLSRTHELAFSFEEAGFFVEYVNLRKSSNAGASGVQTRDLTLIDLPYDGDHWLADARSKGEGVIGIDYLGRGRPDILIRMNRPLGNVPAHRVFYGLDYAIIRREIRTAPRVLGNYVLVSIGGADVNDQGALCAGMLSNWGLKTILVRGPLAKQHTLPAARFRVVNEPPDFSRLLGGCGWAVTNGGTTMLEALSMGKAVHVVPQTAEEMRFASELLERGLLLGIGIDSLRPPEPDRIASLGRRASAAVDGQGANRIVGIGRELVVSRSAQQPTTGVDHE
jgi:spore coat polysaccharide biosynthesis predicted glycosyltransferase SpsG